MYLAVVQDSSIPGDLNTDTGIALANITLAAWAKGVGSCIMGAINKPALSELLGIAAPDKLAFMVALGCPTHAARVVPMTEETGIKYYLDENGDYCVPKRSVEELARSGITAPSALGELGLAEAPEMGKDSAKELP